MVIFAPGKRYVVMNKQVVLLAVALFSLVRISYHKETGRVAGKLQRLLAAAIAILLFSTSIPTAAQQSADDICGTYLMESPVSDDVVKIQIFRTKNDSYQGRYTWLSRPNNPDGTPRTDVKNPNPKLRNRTAFQLVAVWGLVYKEGQWVDGKIYDPTTGKTYGIKAKRMKGSTDIEVRYYWKTTAIGLNGRWRRQ